MDYTRKGVRNSSAEFADMLVIPNTLSGFINNGTSTEITDSGKEAYCFHGDLFLSDEEYLCPVCGTKMEKHQKFHTRLRHITFGQKISYVFYDRHQLLCNVCGKTQMERVPFQAVGHRMTEELKAMVEDYLMLGMNNAMVTKITGVHQATVKDIDMAMLEKRYTYIDANGARHLIRPEKQARYLSIDEIKIHDNYKFATHIIDLETGNVLWIQGGKKKQVVYDFIEHVGMEWMAGVIGIACDMNSDFQEAFQEKCPHLSIIYDHFHIVKNLNENVISPLRRDEQKRLRDEGREDEARDLKNTRYILMSKRSTLQKRDAEAEAGIPVRKGSELFKINSVTLKSGREEKYDRLLAENKLFFTADLVKDMLDKAFRCTDTDDMLDQITEIIYTCWETENEHFVWFGNLLNNHLAGIVTHAALPVSSGKIEGINRKIGNIKNLAYGYHDDEYFFLKVMESSRHPYKRNPKSHKVLQ